MLLMLRMKLLLRSWRVTIEGKTRSVGPVDREVAREVCLRVSFALALFGAVIVCSTDLTEDAGAGVIPAAQHGRRYVPMLSTLIEAGMLDNSIVCGCACRLIDEAWDRWWSEVRLLLLEWRLCPLLLRVLLNSRDLLLLVLLPWA